MSNKYPGGIITSGANAGYSVAFDGTGDYLSAIGTTSSFNFVHNTSALATIEAWVYRTSSAAEQLIFDNTNGSSLNTGFYLSITTGGALNFYVSKSGGAGVWVMSASSSGSTVPTNAWTHVAVTYDYSLGSLNAKFYINGVAAGTGNKTANAAVNTNASSALFLGATTAGTSPIFGYVSNARITNAIVYAAAFTPPTQLLNITNTSLLTCNSPAIVDQSSNAFAITANGNAAVSTFTPFQGYAAYNPALGAATPGVWTVSDALQAAATRRWNMYDPYFNLTTLLLHGNGTNGAQNNTFLDSSSNNFTITRNGNTTQGTFSPFSQTGWSNFLSSDGSAAFSVAYNSAFAPGSGDFTVEGWVYFLKVDSGDQNMVGNISAATGDGDWNIGWRGGANRFEFACSSSGVLAGLQRSYNTTVPVVGQWYHVVGVKSGSTLSCYVNGSKGTDATLSTVNNGSLTLYIGQGSPGTGRLYGYLSNARIVKGTAVYSGSSFTVPTSPLTAITNTSLLTCQSNRFVDNSTNNFTITVSAGTPSVQAFSPFAPTAAYSAATNGGSGYFDGTGDYLTAPDNAAFSFGSGNFTIELWVYLNSSTSGVNITFTAQGTSAFNTDSSWSFGRHSSDKLRFISTSDGGSTFVIVDSTNSFLPAVGQWYHLAAVRNGTTVTLYVNGVSVGSGTNSSTFYDSTRAVGIGASSIGDAPVNGYISNLRIVKGTAVYTAAFTPPTAPLTAITNTSLLLSCTNAGITDATAKNDLETVGNAQISTTQSKFGGSSMYFDGTGDYLTISSPSSNVIQAFGTGNFTVEFWAYFNSVASGSVLDWRTDGNTGPLIYFSSSGTLVWYANGGAAITSTGWSTGQWYHIAVARSGTSTKMFRDGTQVGSTYTDSINYVCRSNGPVIAANLNLSDFANLYIDDLRITKGYARYTGNFTPQTSQWQDQ